MSKNFFKWFLRNFYSQFSALRPTPFALSSNPFALNPKPSTLSKLCALSFLLIVLLFTTIPAHANTRDGLIGWWKFDELSGNATDSSDQGNTGTPTGTTIISNCVRSGCRQFNGSSDLVNLGAVGASATAFTVSVWAYPAVAGQRTQIGKCNSSAAYCNYYIRNAASGFTTGGTNYHEITLSLTTKVWTLVTMTYDGASLCGYLNGVLSGSCLSVSGSADTTGTLSIGRLGAYSGGQFWSGNIDDVRIYNRALTAQEVLDLYNAGGQLKAFSLNGGKLNF